MFREGEVVWLQSQNFKPRRTKVKKVGRKYCYVEGDRDPYSLETGRVKSEYSFGRHILSEKQYSDMENEKIALVALDHFFGIDIKYPYRERALEIWNTLLPLKEKWREEGRLWNNEDVG